MMIRTRGIFGRAPGASPVVQPTAAVACGPVPRGRPLSLDTGPNRGRAFRRVRGIDRIGDMFRVLWLRDLVRFGVVVAIATAAVVVAVVKTSPQPVQTPGSRSTL